MGSGTLLKLTHDMRLSKPNGNACVFRAHTKSGHIELSSLKKQHLKAIGEETRLLTEKTKKKYTELEPFELYTFRHIRSRAGHQPWTSVDAGIPRRIHPQEQTIHAAMDQAGLASSGHTAHTAASKAMPVVTPNI